MDWASRFGWLRAQIARVVGAVPRCAGWYVLDIGTGNTKYFNEPIDPQALVKNVIGLDTTDQSVFMVASDVEEAVVLAARFLTYKKGGMEPRICLRILPEDLEGLVIRVCKSDGSTGIASADCKHFDFLAETSAFVELISRAVQAFDRGDARLRYLSKHQLALQLRAITGLGTDQVDPKRLVQCRTLLKNYNHPL